jgi:hypothetical protein
MNFGHGCRQGGVGVRFRTGRPLPLGQWQRDDVRRRLTLLVCGRWFLSGAGDGRTIIVTVAKVWQRIRLGNILPAGGTIDGVR